MSFFYPILLSGILGFLFSFLEVTTSTYPRTCSFLLKNSWKLYFYSFIYGGISILVMLGIIYFFNDEIIKFEGIDLSNIWVQAAIVGIFSKSFLHVRFFTVNIGSQSIPFGIETIALLFEPWLLREIDLEEFNEIKKFIDKTNNHYTDIDVVKEKIKKNIPVKISEIEKKAFILDLQEITTVSDSMELYLRNFGIKNFKRIFPI